MQHWTSFYTLICLIISLTALVSYLNARYWKIPFSIATMAGALLISIIVLSVGEIHQKISQIDFHNILMQGMLSFLLFAGALNVNFNHLRRNLCEITILAFGGTLLSTFLIAVLFYYLLPLVGFTLPFIYCLIFGALISPTDPIAVLAIFKKVKVSPTLNVIVTGESLFNDGIGIVIFLTLYQVAFQDITPTFSNVLVLFSQEAIGGIFYGIVLGLIGRWMLSSIQNTTAPLFVSVLITLAIVTGGYALANQFHLSGPLAMVMAGIIIGNKTKFFSISKKTIHPLKEYWESLDEVLNALLFFLIGLQLLILTETLHTLWIGVLVVPIVLLIRFITVAIPVSLFKLGGKYPPYFISILTWGGLRGGLAIAMALALPTNPHTTLILTMTYGVVVFSILVQGLTTKPLVLAGKRHASAKRLP